MVANVINDVLFGYRFPNDDCQPLIDYVNQFNEMNENLMENFGFVLGMAFPFLADFPFIGWYVLGRTKHHMQQRRKSSVHFFIAGQETSTYTLRWAMVILAKHAEIQEKLRREILAVVGSDPLPAMADQVKMPYARACVLELQRFTNILGTNVIRVTVNDVTIRGQTIPAGTWVNGDIHYLMANDPVFVNPRSFRPERYLSADGTSLRKKLVDRTLPFSLGKLVCAGEGLARAELFLGLTGTVQRFRILPRFGEEIDLEPVMSTTFLLPKPQGLRLERV